MANGAFVAIFRYSTTVTRNDRFSFTHHGSFFSVGLCLACCVRFVKAMNRKHKVKCKYCCRPVLSVLPLIHLSMPPGRHVRRIVSRIYSLPSLPSLPSFPSSPSPMVIPSIAVGVRASRTPAPSPKLPFAPSPNASTRPSAVVTKE